MRGRFMHERVHDEGASTGGAEIVERGLPICSRRLGLTGKADLVEFREGVPFPIEYKSGSDVGAVHADLQVCAQAMCLEEMTGVPVSRGAVFYYANRRRREVEFGDALKAAVVSAAAAIRSYDWNGALPSPLADGRCRACSLSDACLPFVVKHTQALGRLAAELYTVD